MRVNMKEARGRLRELAERARAGEEVVLMRRGEPIARLVPPASPGRRLPEQASFRAALTVRGRPLSQHVLESRAEERG